MNQQQLPLITRESLALIGIQLADADADALIEQFNSTLQERIGAEVTNALDDTQLKELVDVQESGNMQAVQDWLVANVSDLQKIAQDEYDILMGEIAANADNIQ
jgi:nucleotidyltransferase/DNA polymerase involved in DNA repair